jgi:hypothetical protein
MEHSATRRPQPSDLIADPVEHAPGAGARVSHQEQRRTAAMYVKVRQLNHRGKPLFKGQPERQKVYEGVLRVLETRPNRLGRGTTTAQVLDQASGVETTLLEIYDVGLLWVRERNMRMRGLEFTDGAEFAQTWEIEFA